MKRISLFSIFLIIFIFQYLFAQTDSLRISWNPNPEPDMLEYRLYRSVNSITNFQMIQSIPHPVVQTVDRNSIQPGNLYAFRLTAVDSAGNQSVPSDIVSVGIPHIVWTLNQIPSGSPTTVPLSSFISDPDNNASEMIINISNQNNVIAAVNGTNLVLTPNPLAYVGSAGFTIRIEDPDGFWDIANVQFNIVPANQPPVVSDIPNQTIAEGGNFTTISLDNYVADPDDPDDQISWTYSGNTALTVSISPTRVATITVPSSNWNGSETITFTATDPGGLSDSDPATFTVTPVNDPPVVADIPDETITEGNSFSVIQLDNYVADPDDPDDQIVWTYSGNNQLNVNIDANRVATIIIPNSNWNGSETITFTATDPGGLSDSDPATFTVTPVNDPPVVADIPDETITEGNSFSVIQLDNYVADPDDPDDQIVWTYSGNNQLNVNIDANRVATIIIPNPNWNGSETITFTATDPGGLSDDDPATFTVTGVNDPPQITSTPNTGATQGQLYQYQVIATDPDPGDVLTYTLLVSPGFLSINSTNGLINGTPAITDTGAHNISVRVVDLAGASDTQNYTLNVLYSNNPPVVADIPDQTINEGDTFAVIPLDNYVADPDNPDDEITWTYSGNTELTVSISPLRVATIAPPNPDWNGSETITFIATDPGGLSDSDPATFTVTPVNDPPQITSNPVLNVAAGDLYEYQVTAIDPDPSEVLTYSLTTAPSFLSVNSSSGLISGTPAMADTGSHNVVVRVEDLQGAFDTQNYVLTVTFVNLAPVISGIPDQIIQEGSEFAVIQLDNFVTDPNNLPSELTWQVNGAIDLQVSISNDRIATIIIPDSNWYGSENLEFRATDPSGLWDRDTVVFTVQSVNDPPVINLAQLVIQGSTSMTFDLKPFASDVDNTAFELTWQFENYTHFQFTWEDEINKIIRIETLDGTPSENGNFIVSDPEGLADTSLVVLYYSQDTVNTGPSLALLPEQIDFKEDFSFAMKLDTLIHDVTNTFSELTFQFTPGNNLLYDFNQATGLLTIYSETDWFGLTDFGIEVTDPEDSSDTKIINVKVEPVVDLKDIQFQMTSKNEVSVEVDTDLPSTMEMSFWVTPFLKSTYKSLNFEMQHNFKLSDLIADTTYNYSLTLQDTAGIEMIYQDSTFSTNSAQSISESVAEIFVYPNPYRPSRGHSLVIFDNLPIDMGGLSIFSLTGDLVYEKSISGVPQRRLPWNVINNNGEKLASGFYIYVIKGENGKKLKSGKLAIIR